MSVHAPEGQLAERPLVPDDPGHAPGPSPRRRSRFGFLWLRALILLLGMLLGAALLATFQATGSLPPPPVGDRVADQEADVVVSIRESYLNRMIAERAADPAVGGPLQNLRVQLEPNRRLSFVGDVQVLNQQLRANASGTIGVADGRVRVDVDAVRVGALRLPTDLGKLVAEPINAELERLAADGFRIVDVATATDRLVVRLVAADPSQSGQRPR